MEKPVFGPRALLLTAAALSCFAANSLLCRFALAGHAIDAFSFTTLRLVSGAAVLWAIARSRRASAQGSAWPAGAALFAYAILFSLAYTRIPAAVGALALFGAVQVTMISAGFLEGEKPGTGEWLGALVAAAALVGLVAPGLGRPDVLGTFLMALAGAGSALFFLAGRSRGDAVAANADAFLAASVLAVATQLGARTAQVTSTGALLAIVSGAITSGLGYVIWYVALRSLTSLQAGVVQLAVPPMAALGGVALLGETLRPRLLACGLAILGGIAIALRARTARIRA